jgi:hypothetical protein
LFGRITELVIKMGGKKVKKILNWDKKSIKVLKFRGKNTKNIMCEKIVQKVGFSNRK